MSPDLSKRRILAAFISNTRIPAGLESEHADLLALIDQWKSGTLHGIPPSSLPIDPSRPSEHRTFNIEHRTSK